jgi:hypothetical protein
VSTRESLVSRIQLAEKFLEFAFDSLDVYRINTEELDYRQACEKGWAAIAQATMHVNGGPIRQHREFFRIANNLKNSGGIDIETALLAGNTLHGDGFYHGELSVTAIESTLNLIKQTITNVKLAYP